MSVIPVTTMIGYISQCSNLQALSYMFQAVPMFVDLTELRVYTGRRRRTASCQAAQARQKQKNRRCLWWWVLGSRGVSSRGLHGAPARVACS